MKYQYIKLGPVVDSKGNRAVKKSVDKEGNPVNTGIDRYYAKLTNPTKQWENKGKKEAAKRLARMKKGKI